MAISVTLEKIERNKDDNDIPLMAMKIRQMLDEEGWPQWPKIPAGNFNNVKLHASREELFTQYLKRYKQVGANGTLAITRSNATVQSLNQSFRKRIIRNRKYAFAGWRCVTG